MNKLFLLLLFVFVVPLYAFAHGDEASFEKTVGEYLVDIGYSVPTPSEGESVLFDFKLQKADTEESVPFDDVWVKIESDDSKAVVLATGIHNAEFGGPRLSYVFPHEGTYTISARYENKDGSITEASLPMTVTGAQKHTSTSANIVWGIIGLLLGAGAGYAFSKRNPVS